MTARLTVGFLLLGLLGCLSSFGPDLRPRGTHAGLPVNSPNDTCMNCHESEADALARTTAPAPAPHSHAPVSESPAPLVADWMITATQPCTHCHRIRGHE